ncbi:MAG: sel1 repeat family protein [Gammaproteobacteria bacterium]|nr:sel1 repeat family protein [Gammaproteobacteria bacterium]
MKQNNKLNFKIAFIALTLGLSLPVMGVNFDSGVFEFQSKMANKGDAQAQYRLGVLYETGKGTKASDAEALAWYQKAAKQNYTPAKLRITYLDIKKTGYDKGKHGAWLKELQTEAKQSGELMMLVASMHETGFILPKDLEQAHNQLKKAVSKNTPGSESELERIEALMLKEEAASKAAEEKKRQQAALAKKRQAEEAALAQQRQAQQSQAKQQADLAKRKQQLEAEKKRIAAEKHKLEEQKRKLAEQQNKSKAASAAPVDDSSDPCKGPKARFMTMCK